MPTSTPPKPSPVVNARPPARPVPVKPRSDSVVLGQLAKHRRDHAPKRGRVTVTVRQSPPRHPR